MITFFLSKVHGIKDFFSKNFLLDYFPYSYSMGNSNQVVIEIHGGVIPIVFWFVNYMQMTTLLRARTNVSALFEFVFVVIVCWQGCISCGILLSGT